VKLNILAAEFSNVSKDTLGVYPGTGVAYDDKGLRVFPAVTLADEDVLGTPPTVVEYVKGCEEGRGMSESVGEDTMGRPWVDPGGEERGEAYLRAERRVLGGELIVVGVRQGCV
jgi:hypothetical protein